jgi:hypothetical protein
VTAGQEFSRTAQVVLDASGGGQASIFPPGMDWVINLSTVSTSTAVKVPTANVYRNFIAQANFVEGSYTGSNDSSDTRIVLHAGEALICVWTGGDPGATAAFRVSGFQYPSGQAPAR